MANAQRVREPGVVLVEPSKVIAGAVERALGGSGISMRCFDAVAPALAHVAAHGAVSIISSVELADFPGASLLAALRACPRHRAIPVAFITSGDLEALEDLHPPPDAVIDKREDLVESVGSFLRETGLDLDTGHRPSFRSAARAPSILLAEDVATINRLLAHFLHTAGADVSVARNGREALAFGRANAFDLVLMDLEMPELDGRASTRALRDAGVAASIVALTAHEVGPIRDELLSIGFTDAVSKPIGRDELVARCIGWIAGEALTGSPPAASPRCA